MMVTFISQCQKKAFNRTRRVLDAFANRIGDNSWQTVITEEGLLAVKKLLRKSASKNTAVACHWLRSRSRSELLWVVGNKRKFNHQGVVPVNSTQVNRSYRDDLADWHYLPVIQSLAAMSALLHDWGKASARFQAKLAPNYKGHYGDGLRHEWISCLLLKALLSNTDSNSDAGWLSVLSKGEIDEQRLKAADLQAFKQPLAGLPATAKLIAWLVVTHHKLPLQSGTHAELLNKHQGDGSESLDQLLIKIDAEWGYQNPKALENLQDCLIFPNGLLSNSPQWLKEVKRWAKKLQTLQPQIEQLFADGSYRPVLHHARLCLMLGDHHYSSLTLKESGKWQENTGLIANTQRENGLPKQALDQHLIGVYKQARDNANKLPLIEKHLPDTSNTAALKRKSPAAYAWQDNAAAKVKNWTRQNQDSKRGFFAVNMASTGCGKTFANAKVMLALSPDNDSLRYILALGLRTLTLQTGDEYRQRIFQRSDGSDLAVLIGSKAVTELHNEQASEAQADRTHTQGSESQQSLLDENDMIDYDADFPAQGLDTVLRTDKERNFLYAPILACTIDHIMAATETTRGGRYILPSLRLMSSDLVIDEVDDFTGADAIAIGRLIHLAGMLGRKVMISSATIPPALAEGYYNCYREGWQLFSQTRNAQPLIGCAWIDEYSTQITDCESANHTTSRQNYASAHAAFIAKRVRALDKQPAKRKANIIDCQQVLDMPTTQLAETDKQLAYFETILADALNKHRQHHQIDAKTGIRVSFGVIRTANIPPCIALTRYLLDYDCSVDTEIRVMAYHSQQVLLLRHEQEKHLDAVLKRKEQTGEQPAAFQNTPIRQHLDHLANQPEPPTNLLFILVATPVEEVGRDHDFDWAVVEPSSYRSIVQLAGRVRRHREGEVAEPNIGLLQYNWKTVQSGDKPHACYFSKPGYEFNADIAVNNRLRPASCVTHNLNKLVDAEAIARKLDATPRIDENPPNGFGLARLEHAVIAHWLKQTNVQGPETLAGYLTQHWYLTGLPQRLNPFRQSTSDIRLYRAIGKHKTAVFLEIDAQGNLIRDDVYADLCDRAQANNIQAIELSSHQQQRLWLYRDFNNLLQKQAEQRELSLISAALRFAELTLRMPNENDSNTTYLYNDQLGLVKDIRR